MNAAGTNLHVSRGNGRARRDRRESRARNRGGFDGTQHCYRLLPGAHARAFPFPPCRRVMRCATRVRRRRARLSSAPAPPSAVAFWQAHCHPYVQGLGPPDLCSVTKQYTRAFLPSDVAATLLDATIRLVMSRSFQITVSTSAFRRCPTDTFSCVERVSVWRGSCRTQTCASRCGGTRARPPTRT